GESVLWVEYPEPAMFDGVLQVPLGRYRGMQGAVGLAWPQVSGGLPELRELLEAVAGATPGAEARARFVRALDSRPGLKEWLEEKLATVRCGFGLTATEDFPRTVRGRRNIEAGYRDYREYMLPALSYEVPDLTALAALELVVALNSGLAVRACRNCKEFFTPVPAHAWHCAACKKDSTYQQLYYHRRMERLDEKEREEQREKWRKAKRKSREKIKKKEGKGGG
ncbi:MAG: hypothetical protein K6T66_15670, partial [Peptococcaceae bacterium]|nr:hypothetical protein [Peptococcaceae bacterium]